MDVLIVDDDASVRHGLKRTLRRFGFTVRAVDNGLAALAVLQEERAHAILCDIRMAFLDGGRFYDELASTLPAAARRVIFMTSCGSSDQIDLMEQTGRPVILKPIDIRHLLSTIQSLTDQHDPPEGRPANGARPRDR